MNPMSIFGGVDGRKKGNGGEDEDEDVFGTVRDGVIDVGDAGYGNVRDGVRDYGASDGVEHADAGAPIDGSDPQQSEAGINIPAGDASTEVHDIPESESEGGSVLHDHDAPVNVNEGPPSQRTRSRTSQRNVVQELVAMTQENG